MKQMALEWWPTTIIRDNAFLLTIRKQPSLHDCVKYVCAFKSHIDPPNKEIILSQQYILRLKYSGTSSRAKWSHVTIYRPTRRHPRRASQLPEDNPPTKGHKTVTFSPITLFTGHFPPSNHIHEASPEKNCRTALRVRGGAVVEAPRYKPEGRGIDSRWCH
jgi:hypothetical protein